MKPRTVQLIDGPFDGRHVLAFGTTDPLAIEGQAVPEGQAARYLPTADPLRYRFVGLATVLERLEQVA